MGASSTSLEIPADLQDEADKYREKLVEAVAETDDALLEKLPRRRQGRGRGDQGGPPRAHDRRQAQPVLCGSALQEQGRAAAARRRRRLPPSPLDIPPVKGRPETGRRARAAARRRRAVLGSGLQDHDRPVRRPARVLPRLLGPARRRARGCFNCDQGQPRAHRPHPQDARQQARSDQGSLGRRHRRRRRPEERDHGRHALRPRTRRSCSKR